jgi:hypothetical protein
MFVRDLDDTTYKTTISLLVAKIGAGRCTFAD